MPKGRGISPENSMTNVEKTIVEKVVTDLLATGYAITLVYGDEDSDIKQCTDAATILAGLHQCDEEVLLVYPATTHDRFNWVGWVKFIYGNDGYDVIADYTLSLEAVLAGAEALADQLANTM